MQDLNQMKVDLVKQGVVLHTANQWCLLAKAYELGDQTRYPFDDECFYSSVLASRATAIISECTTHAHAFAARAR